MIFYKVGDPDRVVQTPNIVWDTNAGLAGLDEISIGNNWYVTNAGNAIALWNPAGEVTTLTINFNDTTVGKNVVVTVASNDRDSVGVGGNVFSSAEWQEEVNAAVQSTMVGYFIENGDWTLSANGTKASDDVFTDSSVLVVDATD